MFVLAACFASLAAVARPAFALPTFGGGRANCTSCHANEREAATPSVLNITAEPGDMIPLIINMTNGADAYSATVEGLGAPGLAGFTPDAGWVNHTSAGSYNPDPQYGGPFFALSDTGLGYQGPVSHFFNMTLSPNTQPGTYPLAFTVGGSGNEGLWRDSNPFTLTVVPEPSALALATIGVAGGIVCWRRRRRQKHD
jgi:hypothetical protein